MSGTRMSPTIATVISNVIVGGDDMCAVISWISIVGWIFRARAMRSRSDRWTYVSVTKLGPITDTGISSNGIINHRAGICIYMY